MTLYKKFLADQEQEQEKEKSLAPAQVFPDSESDNREKAIRKKKNVPIPYSIAVCSLKEGSGCTYFSLALEKYLQKKGKKAFLVSDRRLILEDSQTLFKHIYMAGEYDHIIYDFGCIRNLGGKELNQVQMCQGKIMICQLTDAYLQDLAKFIEDNIKHPKSWTFLFNFVPPKKEKKVGDLMEDYRYGILPVFSPEEDKVMEKLLREVWL